MTTLTLVQITALNECVAQAELWRGSLPLDELLEFDELIATAKRAMDVLMLEHLHELP